MKNEALVSTSLALWLTSQLVACGADPADPTDPTGTTGPADTTAPVITPMIVVDGVERQYLVTIPESYVDDEPVPLLFNLHALQSTAEQQLADSQFDAIAEREGFILVTPQAVGGVWTVTGFPIDNGADDFAFITALIAELSATYSIDADRVYATGMSQGGFLAFDLVCSSGPELAAIAPVSGVMTPDMTAGCAPARRVPVLQTHGTADAQIDYAASQAALAWWIDFNGANPTPEVSARPDTSPDNGTTVDHLVYAGGETGVDVEHLRINGGGHVWPGSDSDIDMAEEIWSFLSRYDLNGRIDDGPTTP